MCCLLIQPNLSNQSYRKQGWALSSYKVITVRLVARKHFHPSVPNSDKSLQLLPSLKALMNRWPFPKPLTGRWGAKLLTGAPTGNFHFSVLGPKTALLPWCSLGPKTALLHWCSLSPQTALLPWCSLPFRWRGSGGAAAGMAKMGNREKRVLRGSGTNHSTER